MCNTHLLSLAHILSTCKSTKNTGFWFCSLFFRHNEFHSTNLGVLIVQVAAAAALNLMEAGLEQPLGVGVLLLQGEGVPQDLLNQVGAVPDPEALLLLQGAGDSIPGSGRSPGTAEEAPWADPEAWGTQHRGSCSPLEAGNAVAVEGNPTGLAGVARIREGVGAGIPQVPGVLEALEEGILQAVHLPGAAGSHPAHLGLPQADPERLAEARPDGCTEGSLRPVDIPGTEDSPVVAVEGIPGHNTETHEADHEGVPPGDEVALRVGAVPQADLQVDPPMRVACQPHQEQQ